MTDFPAFYCVLCAATSDPLPVAAKVKGDPSGVLKAVRCTVCDHVQLFPPNYDLGFYEQDGQVSSVVASYGTPMAKVFEHSWIEAKRRADRFASHGIDLSAAGHGFKVLDVGGGYGFFAAELLRRAPDAKVIVMEPSALRVELGLAELKATVEDALVPKFDIALLDEAYAEKHRGAYDLVTLWHVLEHVPDPVGLIRLALTLLKSETGRLCVEVPNHHDDLLTLSPSYKERHYMGEHISYFSPEALKTVALRAAPSAKTDVFGYQRYGIYNYFHWAHFNKPQGADPDMFPGADRWWLEEYWRDNKERNRTSDALFMIVAADAARPH